MQVRNIMTEDPACCTPSDTAARAASLMQEHDCGCVPVIESRESMCVVGVITDRDIAVRGVRSGRSPDTEVGELMTLAPYCCSPDADVREVESIMADRQVRRVVVVDDGGCCLGIVAQADIARAAERRTDVTDDEVGRVVERISEPPHHQEWRL